MQERWLVVYVQPVSKQWLERAKINKPHHRSHSTEAHLHSCRVLMSHATVSPFVEVQFNRGCRMKTMWRCWVPPLNQIHCTSQRIVSSLHACMREEYLMFISRHTRAAWGSQMLLPRSRTLPRNRRLVFQELTDLCSTACSGLPTWCKRVLCLFEALKLELAAYLKIQKTEKAR